MGLFGFFSRRRAREDDHEELSALFPFEDDEDSEFEELLVMDALGMFDDDEEDDDD